MRISAKLPRRGFVLLAIATALAVGGGLAYATIPGSDGVISGCWSKRTGVLRVIDREASTQCLASENALDWNQRGPSDGWDAQLVGTVPTGGSDVQLSGGVSGIPPGSYLISSSVTWAALDTGSASLFCSVQASGTDLSGSTLGGFGTASTAGGGTVAMNGSITVNSGTATLGVECRENSGTVGVPVQARVHAIQVGTLH